MGVLKGNKDLRDKLFCYSFEKTFSSKMLNVFHKYDNNAYIDRILEIDSSRSLSELQMKNRHELEQEYRRLLCI